MRLFIALKLPEAVITELIALQQRLKRSAGHPVKWVAPETIHLTLQFLGEIAEEHVPALITAVNHIGAAQQHQLPLQLAASGAFPNLRRPQVIWVGVAGDLPGLERLYQATIDATQALGFPPEERRFRAHITIGRVRRDATPTSLAALGNAIAALPAPSPIGWESGMPILYQSTLTNTGPIYRPLSDCRL